MYGVRGHAALDYFFYGRDRVQFNALIFKQSWRSFFADKNNSNQFTMTYAPVYQVTGLYIDLPASKIDKSVDMSRESCNYSTEASNCFYLNCECYPHGITRRLQNNDTVMTF